MGHQYSFGPLRLCGALFDRRGAENAERNDPQEILSCLLDWEAISCFLVIR